MLNRVGQVWEDQASRVHLILETTFHLPDDPEKEPYWTHKVLPLTYTLNGAFTDCYEFDDYPWESLFTRHA